MGPFGISGTTVAVDVFMATLHMELKTSAHYDIHATEKSATVVSNKLDKISIPGKESAASGILNRFSVKESYESTFNV